MSPAAGGLGHSMQRQGLLSERIHTATGFTAAYGAEHGDAVYRPRSGIANHWGRRWLPALRLMNLAEDHEQIIAVSRSRVRWQFSHHPPAFLLNDEYVGERKQARTDTYDVLKSKTVYVHWTTA